MKEKKGESKLSSETAFSSKVLIFITSCTALSSQLK